MKFVVLAFWIFEIALFVAGIAVVASWRGLSRKLKFSSLAPSSRSLFRDKNSCWPIVLGGVRGEGEEVGAVVAALFCCSLSD